MSTTSEGTNKWVFWLVMGLGGLLIFNLSRGAWGLIKAQDRMKVAEERLAKLTKQKTDLEAQLRNQMSDNYADREIRNKLGMAKPGEMVVILPEQDESPRQGTGSPALEPNIQLPSNEPNWQKWLSALGF